MTITQEKISDLKSLVRINLKKEDYEPKVTEALKKLAKKADIKGFRKGMVPTGVVKKMYGNSVLAEEINKDLNDQMWKYLQDNKIDILGQPIPAPDQAMLDIDINSMADVDFAYEIGLAPEIDLSYIEKAPAFTKYKITIEDKMVDEEIDRIRKRFATYEYPENVEANDILSLTIEELNTDDSLKEGGVSTVSSVMMDLIKKEYQKDFLALTKGGSTEQNVWDIIDRDKEGIAKNILNLTDLTKIDEVGNNFKLTLNNITRSKPADIDEEFFKKVYGENGPKTEEEMRENIKKELDAYFDGQTDGFLINDLYKAVIENVDFPLPDDFMKRWIKVANEKDVTDEEIDRDYPKFAKQLRWDLITRKLIRENNIENSPEEVKERVRQNTIQQLYGYGLRDLGGDWVEQFISKQMNDKEALKQTGEQLLTDKVMYHIKSKVKTKDTPISFDDFKALNDKAGAEEEERA
ncbi:MAG: Trigger factor [Bacteroidetes bacterium]|nr:Trigger factor [Bacteroidota bacterium]